MNIVIIEGERLQLSMQKITIRAPQKRQGQDGLAHMVHEFTIERRGEGEIVKDNSFTDAKGNPKPRFDSRAKLAVGEVVRGKRLRGWAGKPVCASKGGAGRTGGHTGQSAVAEPTAYLELVVGFDHFPVQPIAIHKGSLSEAFNTHMKQLTDGERRKALSSPSTMSP